MKASRADVAQPLERAALEALVEQPESIAIPKQQLDAITASIEEGKKRPVERVGFKLIAHDRTVDEIRDYLGVDSLHYLSHEGMLSCVKMAPDNYCTACFSGDYPMDVTEPVEKFAMDRGQLKMFT